MYHPFPFPLPPPSSSSHLRYPTGLRQCLALSLTTSFWSKQLRIHRSTQIVLQLGCSKSRDFLNLKKIQEVKMMLEYPFCANRMASSRVYSPFGEENGNPLQYSCLENSMDRRAWWATVYGVPKSRIRLSD